MDSVFGNVKKGRAYSPGKGYCCNPRGEMTSYYTAAVPYGATSWVGNQSAVVYGADSYYRQASPVSLRRSYGALQTYSLPVQHIQSQVIERVQPIQNVQPVVVQPVHYIQQVGVESDDSELRERLAQREKYITELESEIRDLKNRAPKVEVRTERVEVEKRSTADQNRIRDLEQEIARLNGKLKEKDEENANLRKRITRLEQEITEGSNWEAKIRLLTEEIERLNHALEDKEDEVNKYKKKYLEFSNMVETLNNTLAAYVVQCALLESFRALLGDTKNSAGPRKSVLEQLNEIEKSGGGHSSSKIVKVTEEWI